MIPAAEVAAATTFWMEAKDFISHGSNAIVVIFMLLFVLTLMWVFIKGTLSIDIKSLFIDETTNKTSHVKYWANVAYLSATISFLSINLFYFKESSQYIEMLWLIYLGVVASNATVSKLISYKYGASTSSNVGSFQQQMDPDPVQQPQYNMPARRQYTQRSPTKSQSEIDSPD